MHNTFKKHSLSVAVLVGLNSAAYAQDTQEKEATESFEQIVVTASPAGVTAQEASVSVSSFDEEAVAKLAPRSTAEVFRALPGIRARPINGRTSSLQLKYAFY